MFITEILIRVSCFSSDRFKAFLCFCFIVLLFGCEPDENQVVVIPKAGETIVRNDTVIVWPEEIQYGFRNPMMGFREFFSPGVDIKRKDYPLPFGSMVKEYMQWVKLEEYANDDVDKIKAYSNHRWKEIEKQNVKVIPRVLLEWPEEDGVQDPSIPDDIRGTHWPKDLQTGDYFSADFKNRLIKFVEKLALAWDNDPRVAYVEMGIIGQWAEHHTPSISDYWPTNSGEPHVPNKTWIPGIEKVLGDVFSASFKNKKILVRYAYDFKDYEFGLIWDSWAMPEEQARGYSEIMKLPNRWKKQPVGGELTWNWGTFGDKYQSVEELLADPGERFRMVNLIRELHCNHLGGITWANFSDANFFENANEVQKAMGYRFVIDEFKYPLILKSNEDFKVRFSVTNTGSSPFYYDWPVEISLHDVKTKEKIWGGSIKNLKISEWMPGESWDVTSQSYLTKPNKNIVDASFRLPSTVPSGNYIICVSVLDPSGNIPSLRFAINNYHNGGRHPMGYVGVNIRSMENYAVDKNSFDGLLWDKSLHYKL
ncbi:DUF4832 domain-containing protein [Rufibacter aurantiacus]|uniref:DUF4832 domain-containing protein n=1 Tax=Rufibacter aurantiacus TaxID=2817374 RepID=UPI001B30D327|nr:DUF4832 domain-containing protein [Rufibacter aurantiacus]